jgi:hypothetical protein
MGWYLAQEPGKLPPNGSHPGRRHSLSYHTFRWHAGSRGTLVESLGSSLPVPLFRTGTGFLGAWQGDLPEEI